MASRMKSPNGLPSGLKGRLDLGDYDFIQYTCGCSVHDLCTVPHWFLCKKHERILVKQLKKGDLK